MKKDIKVVALDLDGTLTNSQKEITPATRAAIDQAREQDIKIVLASGRPHIGIHTVAEALDVKNNGGYILSFNGGKIVECKTGEVIYEKTIDSQCFEDICDCVNKFDDVSPLTYDDEGIVTEHPDAKYVLREAFNCTIPIRKVDSLYDEVRGKNIVKFMIVGEHEKLEPVREYLLSKYADKLSVYYSETYFLEIMAPNIAKDKSLAVLLEKFGTTKDHLMACGDGLNDLPMLKYAGFSVAMENACEQAKEVSDYITKSNDEDGVAYALHEFVL